MRIPLYLKTSPDMPRPEDSEYYLLARDGLYFCRNHDFFKSDVPTDKMPRWLAAHWPQCRLRFPRLGRAALEFVVGFFARVYERHGSEAIVFLLWNEKLKRYRLLVPEQEASVRVVRSGRRSAEDVRYVLPKVLLPGETIVGDIHSHGDHGAYSSLTDRTDEHYRDGLHAVVGKVDREPPEFHVEFAVHGERFRVQFDHIFAGYERRRRIVPRAWMDQVKVKVSRDERRWSSSQW